MSILNKEIYRKDYIRHVEALLFSNNAITLKQIIKNKLSINNFTLIFLQKPYNF